MAFPGERSEHHMQKLARSAPGVTCGSCRQFDGSSWCRRWNYHTDAASPICAQFRSRASAPAGGSEHQDTGA